MAVSNDNRECMRKFFLSTETMQFLHDRELVMAAHSAKISAPLRALRTLVDTLVGDADA